MITFLAAFGVVVSVLNLLYLMDLARSVQALREAIDQTRFDLNALRELYVNHSVNARRMQDVVRTRG